MRCAFRTQTCIFSVAALVQRCSTICMSSRQVGDTNVVPGFSCDSQLAETMTWSEVKATGGVPEPVAGHTLTYLAGKLYLFGGTSRYSDHQRQVEHDDDNDYSNQFYMFDLKTSSWSVI